MNGAVNPTNLDPEYYKRMMLAQVLQQQAMRPADGNPWAAGLGQLASAYGARQQRQKAANRDGWAQRMGGLYDSGAGCFGPLDG